MKQADSDFAATEYEITWGVAFRLRWLYCYVNYCCSSLLPAERPLRHSGDTSYPAHRLQAGSRHQEWIGGGWASPLYKHSLLVNLRALIREKFVLASFFSRCLVSFSPSLPFRSTQFMLVAGGLQKHFPFLSFQFSAPGFPHNALILS